MRRPRSPPQCSRLSHRAAATREAFESSPTWTNRADLQESYYCRSTRYHVHRSRLSDQLSETRIGPRSLGPCRRDGGLTARAASGDPVACGSPALSRWAAPTRGPLCFYGTCVPDVPLWRSSVCQAVVIPYGRSSVRERGLNGLTPVPGVGVVADRRYGRVAFLGSRNFMAIGIWWAAERIWSVPGRGHWSTDERGVGSVGSAAEGAAMTAVKKRRSHRPDGSGGEQVHVIVPPMSPALSPAAARALLRLVRNVAGKRGHGGAGASAASPRVVSGEREAA